MVELEELSTRFDRICDRLVALEGALGVTSSAHGTPPPSKENPKQEKIDSDLFKGDVLPDGYTASARTGLSENELRLTEVLKSKGFSAFRFVRVVGDYYEMPLEFRMKSVGAPSISHLCKSMVMVNTKAPSDVVDCSDRKNSKYYLVVLQYTENRTHGEKLKNFLHALNEGRCSRKSFNMRLAPQEISDELSGFEHNAVSPFGCKTEMPIILSHKVAALSPGVFFLGAGEVDLKVCVRLDEFIEKYDPFVVDCTYDDDDD
ncbi:hypothetical protein BSKO_09725 [Bryopsis sp. KO-2023]|nr:hypothetical protein BSKO_09725 [Bryopsis sp. KO-2023]